MCGLSYWRIPMRRGEYPLPKFYWNENCLKAPKPFIVDGLYYIDVRRKVRPGLVAIPEPMSIAKDTTKIIVEAMRAHVRNANLAVDNLLRGLM